MYSKRVVHKAYVDGNAYITVGDPFVVANGNPFRAPVKGEKLKNFDIPVRMTLNNFSYIFVLYLFGSSLSLYTILLLFSFIYTISVFPRMPNLVIFQS